MLVLLYYIIYFIKIIPYSYTVYSTYNVYYTTIYYICYIIYYIYIYSRGSTALLQTHMIPFSFWVSMCEGSSDEDPRVYISDEWGGKSFII